MPLGAYTWSVYDSVDAVDEQDWSALTASDVDLTMDRRLVRVLEKTLIDQCRVWHVLIRDESKQAIALASLCLFKVDAFDVSSRWAKTLLGAARSLSKDAFKTRVLFCGLPVPAGQNHLRLRENADPAQVMSALHEAMRSVARRGRASMLVIKEFDEQALSMLQSLGALGFTRGELPPMHHLEGRFNDFDGYCAALKARYRQQVTRSTKKLQEAGFTTSLLTGDAAADAFTDHVHALYLAVWSRSKTKLECLPAEFFRQTARAFGSDALLTTIAAQGQVVAFTFSLANRRVYHNLYSGLDYARNNEADLYFNLFYLDLDQAFRRAAPDIHLGQTSDDFKSRLGSAQRPLWFYVRALSPLTNWGLRRFAKLAFPPVHTAEPHDVFKAPQEKPPRKSAKTGAAPSPEKSS